MNTLLRKFAEDKSGATAIEYCLIAAGVSLAIVATVGSLGSSVKGSYESVAIALK